MPTLPYPHIAKLETMLPPWPNTPADLFIKLVIANKIIIRYNAPHAVSKRAMRRHKLPPADALDSIALFRGLAPIYRERLREKMQYSYYRAGDFIVQQNKRSDAIFIVHTGCAKVCRAVTPSAVERPQVAVHSSDNAESELILTLLGPGAPIGLLSHFSGEAHPSTVVALEPTHCFMLRMGDFMDALDSYPALNDALRRYLTHYVMHAVRRLEITALHNVGGAVAGQLLLLGEHFGQPHDNGTLLIDVPTTQAILAGLTGHSRERVNGVLNTFKKSGWVSPAARRRIIVHDQEALRHTFYRALPRR